MPLQWKRRPNFPTKLFKATTLQTPDIEEWISCSRSIAPSFEIKRNVSLFPRPLSPEYCIYKMLCSSSDSFEGLRLGLRALCTKIYCLLYHFPSTTPYPLLRPIWTDTGWYCWYGTWQESKRLPYKWSLFQTNNIGQYPSRTLFGTLYVRGRECTVFLTSG